MTSLSVNAIGRPQSAQTPVLMRAPCPPRLLVLNLLIVDLIVDGDLGYPKLIEEKGYLVIPNCWSGARASPEMLQDVQTILTR